MDIEELDIKNKTEQYETVKFFNLEELNECMRILVEYNVINITSSYNKDDGDYFIAWLKRDYHY